MTNLAILIEVDQLGFTEQEVKALLAAALMAGVEKGEGFYAQAVLQEAARSMSQAETKKFNPGHGGVCIYQP